LQASVTKVGRRAMGALDESGVKVVMISQVSNCSPTRSGRFFNWNTRSGRFYLEHFYLKLCLNATNCDACTPYGGLQVSNGCSYSGSAFTGLEVALLESICLHCSLCGRIVAMAGWERWERTALRGGCASFSLRSSCRPALYREESHVWVLWQLLTG
jgi:hypothetical protein